MSAYIPPFRKSAKTTQEKLRHTIESLKGRTASGAIVVGGDMNERTPTALARLLEPIMPINPVGYFTREGLKNGFNVTSTLDYIWTNTANNGVCKNWPEVQ